MVDTEKKYGIRNRQALLLFAQVILVKLGLLVQALVLIFIIVNNLSPYMLVSTIAMIVAHLGIFAYCYVGYKKAHIFYYITVGLFLLAIFINIAMPFRDIVQHLLLTSLFGLMSVFMFKQEDYKFTNVLVLIAAVVALAFGIYSSIIANPNSMGEVAANKFPVIVMYLSIFAPIVMVGLFGAAYNARWEKEHRQIEEKPIENNKDA